MRRALAVLLLVAGCTHGGAKAVTTASPTFPPDTCEEEAKTAHANTITVDVATGAQISEAPRPLKPRTDGLFSGPRPYHLPPLTTPVTYTKRYAFQAPVFNSPKIFHPKGRPAWTLPSGIPETETNGVIIVQGSAPMGLYAVDAGDGHLKWVQGSFHLYGLSTVGVTGNDLVLVEAESYQSPPTLEKVDAKTAWVRWRTQLPRGDAFAVSGDYVVVTASAQSFAGHGEVQVINQRTGKPLWRKRFPLPRITNAKLEGTHLLLDNQTRSYGGGCG